MDIKNLQSFESQAVIQRYISGEMSTDELKDFNNAIAKNPALKEEVEFGKAMLLTLQNKETAGVHSMFSEIISENEIAPDFEGLKEFEGSSGAAGTGWQMGKWLLGSLFVAVLSSITWWGVSNNWSFNSKSVQLADQYLDPYENIISMANFTDPSVQAGMKAYDAKDYKTAIAQLTDYDERWNDVNIKLYVGIAHLMDENPTMAIPILRTVADMNAGHSSTIAKYYQALAHLKKDEVEQARLLIEEIRTDVILKEQSLPLWESLNKFFPKK